MDHLPKFLFLFQVLAGGYGLYNEIAPDGWALKNLPVGMGWGLALIAATMSFTTLVVEKEREERRKDKKDAHVWDTVARRLSVYVPTHEREFYSLWQAQVSTAQNNIDVTHLGPRPPKMSHGKEEIKYFEDMKRIVKSSKANIRRVERLTDEKLAWIEQLVVDFNGVQNFSLRLYKDPMDGEMPAAMSVSRIDDRYAWIVAVAEQESTSNYRDVLILGNDGVDLIRRYFQERLWNRGISVIDHGVVMKDWKKKI